MLTARDKEILTALTTRVRLFSIEQIARTWWSEARHPLRVARSRMDELEREGMTRSRIVTVHPELELSAPLCTWYPGMPIPDLATVANNARSRWTASPTALRIVTATKMAMGTFGYFRTRQTKRLEQTHDLHLSTVYLVKRAFHGPHAETWDPEEAVRQSYQDLDDKLPDVLVSHPRPAAIDFIGRYKEARLASLHEYCHRRNLGYEFW